MYSTSLFASLLLALLGTAAGMPSPEDDDFNTSTMSLTSSGSTTQASTDSNTDTGTSTSTSTTGEPTTTKESSNSDGSSTADPSATTSTATSTATTTTSEVNAAQAEPSSTEGAYVELWAASEMNVSSLNADEWPQGNRVPWFGNGPRNWRWHFNESYTAETFEVIFPVVSTTTADDGAPTEIETTMYMEYTASVTASPTANETITFQKWEPTTILPPAAQVTLKESVKNKENISDSASSRYHWRLSAASVTDTDKATSTTSTATSDTTTATSSATDDSSTSEAESTSADATQ
ncbi:hypothetical protein IAU59_002265 [Kwoniella sp. CBS 9459]